MHTSDSIKSYKLLSAFVKAGLAQFAYHALEEEQPIFARLKAESESVIKLEWLPFKQQLEQQPCKFDGILGVFIQNTQLPLHELFLLALLGEMESSHLINLAVSQLQSPFESSRPSGFLCATLIELLFSIDDYNSQDLWNSQLHAMGLIQMQGNGPLPQYTLQCLPELWPILKGKPAHSDFCQPVSLPDDNELLDEQRLLSEQSRQNIGSILPLLIDNRQSGKSTVLVIRGKPDSGQYTAVAMIARALKLSAQQVTADIWQSTKAFNICCHYADWLPVVEPDIGPGESWKPVAPFHSGILLVLLTHDGGLDYPSFIELKLHTPLYAERQAYWQKYLDNTSETNFLASARLSGFNIRKIAETARVNAQINQSKLTLKHIIKARSQYSNEKLRLLAEPVTNPVDQNDLVLADPLYKELEQLITRCQKREQLADSLGHIIQATLNPGIRALFCGPSGTGKTLSASFIAQRLGSPLYRVDISAIMNKYIGETEKNLSLLLNYASASDAILLFDEADSLFGRRNRGDSSSERYANMITNFLLSRIENHDGIVLLTTNNQQDIDQAFIRRFDMILEFSIPSYEQRYQLWRKHCGNLHNNDELHEFLANYCDLSGGHIRNAVLNAALLANDQPIELEHVLSSLQSEYRKLGRSMPPALLSLSR